MMSVTHTKLRWRATSIRDTFILLGLALTLGFITATGCGQGRRSADLQSQQQTLAERDQRALESIGQQAWYDSATHEYRPPKISPDPDHSLRRTGTVAGPQAITNNSRNTTTPFNFSGEIVAQIILSILAALLICLLIAILILSFRNWLPNPQPPMTPVEFNPARVTDLPFDVDNQMQDPLGFAKQLVARGDLDAAIVLLYGYMLLALDHRGLIALHRGKTNRMYLYELGDDHLRKILSAAMLAFEDVFFGRHQLDPQRFYHVWDQLDAFHRRLARGSSVLHPTEEAALS